MRHLDEDYAWQGFTVALRLYGAPQPFCDGGRITDDVVKVKQRQSSGVELQSARSGR